MTKVKICGLTRDEDIAAVNKYLPDYVGFLFYEKSIRNTTKEKAKAHIENLDEKVKSVAVFKNMVLEDVVEIANYINSDMVQLHGKEDDEFIEAVRKATGKPVIKAFSIKTKDDLILAEKSKADCVLLDSGSGGTGESFDWELININREYFLAGGLNPQNAIEAVDKLKPYALDVSSGVETDGVKDSNKIKLFIENTKNTKEA